MKESRLGMMKRLIGLVLPARDRAAVLGDLHEEMAAGRGALGAGWHAAQCLRIALRFHGEPYRDIHDRLGIAGALAAGAVLLWIVPAAAGTASVPADLFRDPITRAVMVVWRASHLTSAVAAGLLVGWWSAIPRHCAPARWHVAGLLAATSGILAPGPTLSLLSVAVLLGGVWLGEQAGRSARAGVGGANPV